MKKSKRFVVVIGAVAILAVGAWTFFGRSHSRGAESYDFVTVERGDLREIVSSTGTVSALEQVEVGTQVSGTIREVFVDFNDVVEAGQLLALIDTENLDASVNEAYAGLQRAQAVLAEAQARLDEARANLERNQPLFDRGYLSEQEFRPFQTAVATAEASVSSAQAQVGSAQAQVAQAQKNRRNAEIRSPISGIIISRSVEKGQTVAASFNTPTLFIIAADLSRMRILASVDESDIGQIKAGQQVEFTVAAYPERTFTGEVKEVRLQGVEETDVVMYTVVVDAANEDGLLLPGMTATVDFVVESVEDVLMVPTVALSVRPCQDAGRQGEQQVPPARMTRGPGGAEASDIQQLWYQDDQGALHAIPVRPGVNNGFMTEIIPVDSSGVLTPGLKVISRVNSNGSSDTPARTSGMPMRAPHGPRMF